MRKITKVIFDGKEMEVISYDEDFQTVEVPVILKGLTGEYCPLNSKQEPITCFMQGDLIVNDDVVDATGIVIWSAISISTIFGIHAAKQIFNYFN